MHSVGDYWKMDRCLSCGTLFLNPRPTDASLSACYPQDYFTHEAEDGGQIAGLLTGFRGQIRGEVANHKLGYSHLGSDKVGPLVSLLSRSRTVRHRALQAPDGAFPAWVPNGRLIDIGCGSGVQLAVLREFGWDVLGLEIDPAAADSARRTYHLDVIEASAAEAADHLEPVDVITMNHVIEHVPDPGQLLRDCTRLLRPGGQLIAVTPNSNALGNIIFQNRWFALDVPRHLLIFSPQGLRSCLARVSDLDRYSLSTSNKRARKTLLDAMDVGRTGQFRSGVEPRPLDRVLAVMFRGLEGLLTHFWDVGEELVLTARRRASS